MDVELSTPLIITYLLSEEVVLLAQGYIKFAFLKSYSIFYSLILRI